jgi:hypothetical protein
MIRIRYRDLSPGSHGKAERAARGVTVYLLPGLTGSQRKAALRRLRQEASRGCGPALPVPQLMVGLGWDRVRTALRAVAAIVRLHPVASLLPAGAAGALIALFVLASVSVPIAPAPLPAAQVGTAARGGPPAAPPAFSPSVRSGDPASVAAALGPEGLRPVCGDVVRIGPGGGPRRGWLIDLGAGGQQAAAEDQCE